MSLASTCFSFFFITTSSTLSTSMNSLFRISFVAINAFMTLGINALPQASSPLPLKNNNNISTPLNNNSTSVAMSASASNNGTKAVSQLGFSQLGCFTSISSSSPAKSSKVLTQGQNVTNLITCLKACKDRNNSKAGGLITACAYGTSPQITCVGLVWNSVQLNSTMIVSTGVSKVANSICSNSCPAGIENGCGGPVNNVSSPSQPPALTVYALSKFEL